MPDLYGGIEAGGTKFVCMIGNGPDDIKAEIQFPTTTPEQTLKNTIDFFKNKQKQLGPLTAIGIGSFGPVDLNPRSATYGYITTPPKPHWANTDFLGSIKKAFNFPIYFDTDVNCATLGEYYWGSAQGINNFVYMTIGTGIGGGAIVNGSILHGLLHTEMGHMRITHDWQEDPYRGGCPYHGDCFEGLTSGPAISERWHVKASDLPKDHPAWNLTSKYIALALYNIICILSPQKIVLGGGVMNQKQLFPMIREWIIILNNHYIQLTGFSFDDHDYIIAPGLGSRSGVLGAIALAKKSFRNG